MFIHNPNLIMPNVIHNVMRFVEKIANNEVDPKSIYDMKEKLGSG